MLTFKQRAERFLLNILKIFPVKKNRIAFICYNCTQYSCNPKYISKYIHKHYKGKYELVWYYTDDPVAGLLPPYVTKYKKNSPGYFISLMTAGTVISNVTLPRVVPFRKNQLRIDTWHGTAFKGDKNKYGNDYNRFDVFLAENELTCGVLRRKDSFDYQNEIFRIGMPRNDILIRQDPGIKAKIKEKLNIDPDERLVIYAPTFRESSAPFNIDFQALKAAFEKKFGGSWNILFRYHHMQSGRIDTEGSVDVTSYPDMQHLLLIADVLITDYSSTMWDFSLMDKPVFIYAEDYRQYVDTERGEFYYPFEKLPFPIAKDNRGLLEAVELFDREAYAENVRRYHSELGRFNYDGNSTKKFVENYILY